MMEQQVHIDMLQDVQYLLIWSWSFPLLQAMKDFLYFCCSSDAPSSAIVSLL